MTRPAVAAGPALDDATVKSLLIGRSTPVRLVGARLHDLAVRLLADAVPVEFIAPRRRDARAYRRAVRHAGATAAAPVVTDVRVELPGDDGSREAIVCRLDPATFPFPRHTVRELGRVIAPGGLIVLLTGDKTPWPAGLVDAWAASAGLAPTVRRSGALPFVGAVYRATLR
jgi:SAM-dependent methyltransferase